MPVSIRIRVVFPAPFGPSKPKMDPFSSLKLIESTAFCPAKSFFRSLASMISIQQLFCYFRSTIYSCNKASIKNETKEIFPDNHIIAHNSVLLQLGIPGTQDRQPVGRLSAARTNEI